MEWRYRKKLICEDEGVESGVMLDRRRREGQINEDGRVKRRQEGDVEMKVK